MVRTIHLHGALGQRFGRSHRLDVVSPAEAVRALCIMLGGFQSYVSDGRYQVFRGKRKKGVDLDPVELHVGFSDADSEMHIVPRAVGAKNRGLGKILLGGLLIAASFAIPGAWALSGVKISATVATLGLSMAIGGVAQILAPQQQSDFDDRDDQLKSSLFGGPTNVTAPGVAVPVAVGELEVGSVVISSAIHVEDRTDLPVG